MALKIKSLKAKNFRCFRDLFLTVPEEGLFYLQGVNQDASYTEYNGVGKTSLMDLPSVILFCRGVRDSEKKKLSFKEYLRHKCKEAELVMELVDSEGPEYTITRTLTKVRTNLTIEYNGQVLHDQFAKEFIEEKLGLTFNSFTSTCLFGQGKFNVFLNSTEGEKVGLLEELFKLTLLDEIRGRIDDRRSELKNPWEAANTEKSRTFAEWKAAEARYTAYEEMYTKERSEAEHFILNNSGRPPMIEVALNDCLIAGKRKSSNLIDLDKDIVASETVLNSTTWGATHNRLEIGKPCPLCRRLVEASVEDREWIDRQNKKQQDFSTIQIRLSELKMARNKITDEIQKLDLKTLELNQEKETLERELDKARKLVTLSESTIAKAKEDQTQSILAYNIALESTNKIELERSKLESLSKLLGSAELRSKIISQYLELINYYAKKYVSFLTNGELSIEFGFNQTDNKITAEVIDVKENYSQSYFGFSGGERSRLDFAVFLGFNQVNRHILKNPLEILFLDETFKEVDQMGIEMALDLLKMEKDNLGPIIITGHNEGMSSLFQNKINLVKKGKVTTLS